MRKRKSWKDCICEGLYCNPEWNRKLICIKCSLDEVCRLLNSDVCCGGNRKRRR